MISRFGAAAKIILACRLGRFLCHVSCSGRDRVPHFWTLLVAKRSYKKENSSWGYQQGHFDSQVSLTIKNNNFSIAEA